MPKCSRSFGALKVLNGCSSSTLICDAFRDLGHEAYTCDLRPCEGDPQFHYQCDVRELLEPGNWDLFIAHPDCTFLTNSAAWAYGDGPYHQQVKMGTLVGAERRAKRELALDFVRELMLAPVPCIAIENPVGVISTRIRPASQYIQPHEYGEDASKKTGLWLKNLPLLKPTSHVEPRWVCCGMLFNIETVGKYECPNCLGECRPLPRWANQTDSGQNRLSPGVDRWIQRSRTYQGWADAMANQWATAIP